MDGDLHSKSIAIIGAGWVGIGCARMLMEAGHVVDIYESLNDVGGTWHPDNCYAGLSIHQSARGIEYFDFPLPDNIDRKARLTSKQIYHYLQDYCRAKGIYNRCNFNKQVEKISYNSKKRNSVLTIKNNEQIHITYDYVINTNGFCDRELPYFKGMESFSGEMVHSFAANEDFITKAVKLNKRITLIGASKTAADFIVNFHKLGYKVAWLYNKPYWFFSFEKLINMTESANKRLGFLNLNKWLWMLGILIASWSPQTTYWLWRLTGLINTFGNKHTDFRKFHTGTLDKNQLKILDYYSKNYAFQGKINQLNQGGILLKDGRQINTDIIICCTGSAPKKFVSLEVDERELNINKIYDVYKSSIIPQIPNLIFTAYLFFSLGTLNGLSWGSWIKKYIELTSDSYDELQLKATKMDYPFFTVNQLFDSRGHYVTQLSKKLDNFFKEETISRTEYNKWLFNEGFFGTRPKPLDFEKGKIKF